MAQKSSVLSDGSRLSRIDRALYRLEGALALISGIAVFALMVLAVVSVGGRNFFNQPLPGYVDWIEQAMPLIAFLGIAYAQRDGGHIRMDLAIGRVRGRLLWGCEWLAILAMLGLMTLLIWGSWAHFLRSFDFDAPLWSRDSSMDIAMPLWPGKLLVPFAFLFLCVRLVLQLWGYGRAFREGARAPVAVPLIEATAFAAAREADTMVDSRD